VQAGHARAAGVTVSLGHSDATFEQASAGFDAGASLVTHLWSAMSPFHHRAPGLPGAALTDERATVALIADGVHTHPAALSLALRAKGPARVALTTDAVAAAGMPPGDYMLGGTPVVSDGGTVRRPGGALAGSLLTMDAAVRNMVALAGARVEEALTMASTVPARLIDLDDAGRLAPGERADLTLWSAELAVRATIVGGTIAYQAQ
jgi:N-acetylglucosamine-6-phosphate deacetylase